MPEEKKLFTDEASREIYDKVTRDGVDTVFTRAEELAACPIGSAGDCCKHCGMGPCRVPEPKKAGSARKLGLCGATAETISARNFIRMIAAGAAAHSDHGRGVAHTFLEAARGNVPGYGIKDEQKLMALALDMGIAIEGKETRQIAVEVGESALRLFGQQEGEIFYVRKAPAPRQEIWRRQGVVPRGVDREVVEVMHRTHMGVDQDYRSLFRQGVRASLADGWGGSMLATDLQDIMFGTPVPVYSEVNLGVLRANEVNVVVHGHEPLLSEMIVIASRDPEMLDMARNAGAEGITIAGICCTANEILMRHGIPIAGNFLQQELAITTGAVDAMVVDVQCVMQSLQAVASCYHTKLITTNPKADITGSTRMEFNEKDPLKSAKAIIAAAIENFPNRKGEVVIPKHKSPMIAGFSHETVNYMLGGSFRASYRPLNDNIINGRIRGVAGVVGCNNARTALDGNTLALVKELIKHDVLVLTTGCTAIACGKEGLLTPEAAARLAGPGLAEVCETVGIPPVLHMGACVDNSRILIAATAMVKDGGLGSDISDLPAAGAAPEWMSEKAIAIGQYFVASGIYTVFGVTWPTSGSKELTRHLFEEMEDMYGARWDFAADPAEMARKMIAHIDRKRRDLGIDRARERVLFDMADRREMA